MDSTTITDRQIETFKQTLAKYGMHVSAFQASQNHIAPDLERRKQDTDYFVKLIELAGKLGIPYIGSGVLASALAMDKLRSRQVLQANAIPVPAYVVVDGGRWPGIRDDIAARVARDLGFPCVVKPNALGSTMTELPAEFVMRFARGSARRKVCPAWWMT